MMAKNLSILHEDNIINLNSNSIKDVLNYLKLMLLSNNTDKIKLILDSKIPVYLITLLNTTNI